METKRNCYDVLDEVISPDNVMNIGELIEDWCLSKRREAFT